MTAPDLTGQRFNMLTVVSRADNSASGKSRWTCTCACGGKTTVVAGNLRSGQVKSCGCAALPEHNLGNRKHGLGGSSEYVAWCAMKTRCYNPNYGGYSNYGGRGIAVCDRWLNSFQAFYEDMGPKFAPELSLDRIDNDGNYEPGNCRWATRSQQSSNQRKRVLG